MSAQLQDANQAQDDGEALANRPSSGNGPEGAGTRGGDTPGQEKDPGAAPKKTPAEILQAMRGSAQSQKTQAEVLTQDSAQVDKDIAELDALLKEREKAETTASEQAKRWKKELEAAEALQKSRAKGVAEELGDDGKKAVIDALGDYQDRVGALYVAVAEALRQYSDAQAAVMVLQAQHDGAKAGLAVVRQHAADTQKARQALDERRAAGFATLRKQIESTVVPEPNYANLLFLRTDLDGVQDGAVPRPDSKAGGVEGAPEKPELHLHFDDAWRQLSALKVRLRELRRTAKKAKDTLDGKQAELDTLVQRRRAEVLKKLEPRS